MLCGDLDTLNIKAHKHWQATQGKWAVQMLTNVSCPMQLDQDDTHQQRLKVWSKASGIIGNVGGRFWYSFSWSKVAFLCHYLLPWHHWGWGAGLTRSVVRDKVCQEPWAEPASVLKISSFLWRLLVRVKHGSVRTTTWNLVAQQVKCHQLLALLNKNGKIEFRMHCFFLQLSTDYIESKFNWKLQE